MRNLAHYLCLNYRKLDCGKKNCVVKDLSTDFVSTRIKINGNNNRITFSKNCNIRGLRVLVSGDNNEIYFGENVTINGSKIQPTVINAIGGKRVIIGAGSLLSNNIEIHTSDYHGIYNNNGYMVNNDKDVIIGEKVWIGLRTIILKGTEISDGCVIGAGSLLAGKYNLKNVVIAGNPAKILRENILWDRGRSDTINIQDKSEI